MLSARLLGLTRFGIGVYCKGVGGPEVARDGGNAVGEADAHVLSRLRVINEVSAAALEHPSREGTCQAVADAIARHFSYFEVNVFEVVGDKGELVLLAQSPKRDSARKVPHRQPIGVGLLGVAVRERRSVLANDVSRDGGHVLASDQEKLCGSELCVPVLAGDQVVAVIDVECCQANAFTESDRLALEAIARVVGLALHAAEVYETLERQVAELRDMQCQLVNSERLADVGRLTSRVAHEIRNPLSTIGGFAHRIQRRPGLDEQTARYAAVIVEEVQRLERLLSGIMDFVRPGQPEKRPVDINSILRRAVLVCEGARAGKSIRVEEDLAPQLPQAMADPDQIQQVFVNIIRNAFDSIKDAGTVTVGTRQAGAEIVVSISDTGEGITPELLSRIFDPFFTTKPGGTGLGLAVASKIVEDHGGRILIGSELGRGTHVKIRLPIGRQPFA